MNAFKEWFLQQTSREQLMLGVGAICVVVGLVYYAVWAPLVKSRESQIVVNQVTLEQREKVRELAGLILGERQSGSTHSSGQSLTQIVNVTLRTHGLSMENFRPSDNSVNLRLRTAELNRVFAWLNEMENKKGVQIKDLSVSAITEQIGFAAVSVTLFRE